jgi:hypothetical protein
MYKLLLFATLICVTAVGAFGQADPNNPLHARVSNAYGEFNEELVRSALDTFFAELSVETYSRGLVIVYGSYKELADRRRLVANHITFRKFDPSRIDFKIGGSISVPRTGLWVIPFGAEHPKIESEAYVFDELGIVGRSNFKHRIDNFYQKLNKGLSQGYIVNYGSPKEIALAEKAILSVRRIGCDIDCWRLTLVNGGNGRKRLTVLWIVPEGAENPPL